MKFVIILYFIVTYRFYILLLEVIEACDRRNKIVDDSLADKYLSR